ncbi:thioredoxin domain-containing protein [Natrononativus amylolyticus]|uniref:thioredoxin domain-containing protein n=1 Tax=Natrononativus amylolyticus TaxID=2963434 RepID=UPI0020CDCBD9|nr:thioredoxin domain-containing protein [Natrononativus amylolyticus]
MGTDGDNPTATVYGNFKCPVTRGFVFGNLEAIIEEFVLTGQLNIEFANLAYQQGDTSSYYISSSDPRMAAFGRAVWDVDPQSYWDFFATTFDVAPSGWVEYDELAGLANQAGVSSVGTAVDRASDGQYDSAVTRVASTAVEDGASFVPILELGGESTAPHHGTQSILTWIDARVDSAPSEPPEEPEEEEPEEEEPEEEEPEEPEEDEPEEEEPEEEAPEEEEPEEEAPEEDESEEEAPEEEPEEEAPEEDDEDDEDDDEPPHCPT